MRTCTTSSSTSGAWRPSSVWEHVLTKSSSIGPSASASSAWKQPYGAIRGKLARIMEQGANKGALREEAGLRRSERPHDLHAALLSRKQRVPSVFLITYWQTVAASWAGAPGVQSFALTHRDHQLNKVAMSSQQAPTMAAKPAQAVKKSLAAKHALPTLDQHTVEKLKEQVWAGTASWLQLVKGVLAACLSVRQTGDRFTAPAAVRQARRRLHSALLLAPGAGQGKAVQAAAQQLGTGGAGAGAADGGGRGQQQERQGGGRQAVAVRRGWAGGRVACVKGSAGAAAANAPDCGWSHCCRLVHAFTDSRGMKALSRLLICCYFLNTGERWGCFRPCGGEGCAAAGWLDRFVGCPSSCCFDSHTSAAACAVWDTFGRWRMMQQPDIKLRAQRWPEVGPRAAGTCAPSRPATAVLAFTVMLPGPARIHTVMQENGSNGGPATPAPPPPACSNMGCRASPGSACACCCRARC